MSNTSSKKLTEDKDEQMMYVGGWGATTRLGRKRSMILQHVEMKEFSFEKCRQLYMKSGVTLNTSVLCAGGLAGKVG